MKRHKLTFLVVLLMVASVLLVACGGGSEGTTESEGTGAEVAQATEAPTEEVMEEATEEPTEEVMEEATEEPAEEATEEPTEEPAEEATEEVAMVERPEGGLLIWADEQRAPIVESLGQRFEEEYGVGIAVQQLAFGDIRDQLKLAGPAGEGPDIIVGAHDWLGELVINGLLSEIDLGDKADLFTEPSISAFTYDGKLYGMPTTTENVAFVYNTELVAEAPTTWDEVMSICEELGDEVEQCFAHIQGDPYHFYPIQTAFGGAVFGRDDAGSYDSEKVEIDSDGSKAAAEALAMMVENGYVRSDVDWEAAHTLFETGDAAFIITGPWAVSRLDDSGVPYAIAAIPSAEQAGRPFLGAQGFMVSAFSEDPLLAQTFLSEFIATEEVMKEMAESRDSASAFQSVLDEQMEADEKLAGFAAAGAEADPMPAIPAMASVWSAWGDAITLIVQGQEEADAAFTNAAEQIRTAIEGQ